MLYTNIINHSAGTPKQTQTRYYAVFLDKSFITFFSSFFFFNLS